MGVDRAGEVLRILGLGTLQGDEGGVRGRGDASFLQKYSF